METDKMYRVIRFFGIGMIFLSLSWAFFRSSTPSQQRPAFAKAVGLYTDGKFEEALKFYNTAVLELNSCEIAADERNLRHLLIDAFLFWFATHSAWPRE